MRPGSVDLAEEAKPRKVAIFVEPSPFSHVSGMRNRFLGLIDSLHDEGDEVTVVTPCVNKTQEYHGVKVVSVLGLRLPFYNSKTLLLGTGMSLRVIWELVFNRPDIIHASSPGMLVCTAIIFAKLLRIPLVVSYHTHIPEYIPRYNLWTGLVKPMWAIIRECSRWCQLHLVTSTVMEKELKENGCKHLDVWQRGVDTNTFNPKFKSDAMRGQMADGREGPLLVHVGRLGSEKNVGFLKGILERIPEANLAIVGDGPERAELEAHFAGTRTKFMGMRSGEELAQCYASGDVFLMPSESETLGFVVLEAMASGVPVVAVAAGGLTDIIEDKKTGLLYPSKDLDQAVELTQSLLQDPARREQIAQGGYEDVQKWSFHASNRRLRNLQYMRAIRRFRIIERFRNLLIRVQIVNTLRRMWQAVMGFFTSLFKPTAQPQTAAAVA